MATLNSRADPAPSKVEGRDGGRIAASLLSFLYVCVFLGWCTATISLQRAKLSTGGISLRNLRPETAFDGDVRRASKGGITARYMGRGRAGNEQ
jgi:hypothetical protein